MDALSLLRIALLLPVLAALPAYAATYKWLDDKGVVNYSNNPPASARPQKAAKIEERISVYSPDPALRQAAAARALPQNPGYAEAEWLQRQRIMHAQQQAQARPADYYDDYGYAGFPVFRAIREPRRLRHPSRAAPRMPFGM